MLNVKDTTASHKNAELYFDVALTLGFWNGLWTTRTQDNSYPGQLVPKTTRTQDNLYPRQLVPKTTRTQDNSYPGQLVPRTTRTQEFGY